MLIALSQLPLLSLNLAIHRGLDYAAFPSIQASCLDFFAVRSSLLLKTEDHWLSSDLPLFACNMSLGHSYPFIPAGLLWEVLNDLHGLHILGYTELSDSLGFDLFGPGCVPTLLPGTAHEACQYSQVQKHTMAPVLHIPALDSAYQHVHMELVGPVPPSTGFAYLLTIVDCTSKPEAFPLTTISVDDCTHPFASS